MSTVTASAVKNLREVTGLPMMECKQALTECNGDFDAAKEWLRKKHKGKLEERAGRETGEGRIGVYVSADRKIGAIVELQCETAPVAKNELFVALADAFAKKVADGSAEKPDPAGIRKDPALDAMFVETYGKLRETMNLIRCQRVQGEFVASYVHHDGKTGVLVALNAAPKGDAIAADLCMHTAFAQPLAIDAAGVPADEIAKVRKQAAEAAKEEGKPESIVEKIVEGRVKSFVAEKALMEQLHARSDVYGKKTVREVLAEAGVSAVVGLAFMKVGAA